MGNDIKSTHSISKDTDKNSGVYVYADESGHSGKELFGQSPLYYQGAVISVGDIEDIVKPIIDSFCSEYGVERLHGYELGEQKVNDVCLALLDVLDKYDWQFHYTIIEKRYIVPTKFVDTIFDSFENPAVHTLWYTTELFRHILSVVIDDMMDEELAKSFWQFYLSDDIDGLMSIAKNILQKAPYIYDKRCEEVVTDGLTYAIENPDIFTLASSTGKSAYKKQTPNMVAFSSLLTAVHRFCKCRNLGVSELIHDQSDEFKGTMREYHRLFFGVDFDQDKFGGIPKFKKVKYELGIFKLGSSKKIYGLQVTDLFLWLVQRDIRDEKLSEAKLKILDSADDFVISREMSLKIIDARHYQLMQLELSKEQLAAGEELNDKIEMNRLKRIT